MKKYTMNDLSFPKPDTNTPNRSHRLVIIATYNERDNIQRLISKIISLPVPFHVLVVDDNSPDGTGKTVAGLARKNDRVHLLNRQGPRSYAGAIVDGFRQALRIGSSRIFTMDADHSHNPLDLIHLDEKLQDAPIVIGSRYLGGIRILNWPLSRLLLSVGANHYVRFLLRLEYADCTSGFRAYRREVLEYLIRNKTNSHGYSFLVEILNQVKQAGYKVEEVPIIYTERRAGQSKMSRLTIWEAIWRPWLLLFRRIMRRNNR